MRAAGDANASHDQAIPSDVHVVRDLDNVVDLRAAADDGVVERSAIDAAARSDLHVVLDDAATDLRDPSMSRRVGHKSEARRRRSRLIALHQTRLPSVTSSYRTTCESSRTSSPIVTSSPITTCAPICARAPMRTRSPITAYAPIEPPAPIVVSRPMRAVGAYPLASVASGCSAQVAVNIATDGFDTTIRVAGPGTIGERVGNEHRAGSSTRHRLDVLRCAANRERIGFSALERADPGEQRHLPDRPSGRRQGRRPPGPSTAGAPLRSASRRGRARLPPPRPAWRLHARLGGGSGGRGGPRCHHPPP